MPTSLSTHFDTSLHDLSTLTPPGLSDLALGTAQTVVFGRAFLLLMGLEISTPLGLGVVGGMAAGGVLRALLAVGKLGGAHVNESDETLAEGLLDPRYVLPIMAALLVGVPIDTIAARINDVTLFDGSYELLISDIGRSERLLTLIDVLSNLVGRQATDTQRPESGGPPTIPELP